MWQAFKKDKDQVSTPEFTSDWFSRYIPTWVGFFQSIGWKADKKKIIIEIGSFEGRSALWILENLIQHPDSHLHCVDTFPDFENPVSYGARFKKNIKLSQRREQCSMHAMTSVEFLLSYAQAGRRADFIYIDGSHQAADVLEDLVLAFRILNPGGLIICDDYLGGEPKEVLSSPKISIDAFTTIFRDKLEIISPQPLYQLAFIKRLDATGDDPTSRGEK